MSPTCPTCDHIHARADVYAVGRFDPSGVRGYTPRVNGVLSGDLYSTHDEAAAALCAARAER